MVLNEHPIILERMPYYLLFEMTLLHISLYSCYKTHQCCSETAWGSTACHQDAGLLMQEIGEKGKGLFI